MRESYFTIENHEGVRLLRLRSPSGTNCLTRPCILALTDAIQALAGTCSRLAITGNESFFSAGADLAEIRKLTAPAAYEFARDGQILMNSIASFPAPVCAAISGYCMGGGMDLALACHHRIAAANAVFGHRGAALGLITGWGGTQRLTRLVGKGIALQMFLAAETVDANRAQRIGLVQYVAADPVDAVLKLPQTF